MKPDELYQLMYEKPFYEIILGGREGKKWDDKQQFLIDNLE